MLLGINTNPVLAKEASLEERSENDAEVADIVGLRKIEDDSVKSNIHTAKWRVFTDNGRESFMQAGIYRLYALLFSFFLLYYIVCLFVFVSSFYPILFSGKIGGS